MDTTVAQLLRISAALALLATAASAQLPYSSRVTTRIDGRQIGPSLTFPDHSGLIESMSDDGRFVVFFEYLEPVPPLFSYSDVRLLDRANGTQAPIALGMGGAPLDADLGWVHISGDGNRVFFECYATNLPGGISLLNGGLFLSDRASGQLSRVSQGIGGAEPDDTSYIGYTSTDGRFVTMSSWATNLVLSDNNNTGDLFLVDLQAGTTARASLSNSGAESNGESYGGPLSQNGRFVAFDNGGDDLDPADSNGQTSDVYLRDMLLGTTELISVTPAGSRATRTPVPSGYPTTAASSPSRATLTTSSLVT